MHPLRRKLHSAGHRGLLILSGSRDWQQEQIASLWHASEQVLLLGETAARTEQLKASAHLVDGRQLIHYLGQETDGIVLDARQGFSANALGITAGMIRAGGLLVVLTPPKKYWRQLPNLENRRFLNTPFKADQTPGYFFPYLINRLKPMAESGLIHWLQQENPPSLNNITLGGGTKSGEMPQPSLLDATMLRPSPEQAEAIQAIRSVAFGHRKRPLLVHADRGRGKSALLGLAAVDCLLQGKEHIAITAARFDQAATAFQTAEKHLVQSGFVLEKSRLELAFVHQGRRKTLHFVAPDELLEEPSHADLLMVDEAAHLPTPLLEQLLRTHHRMLFATTLHGYEGSGRGFELRFAAILDRLTPNWKRIQLHHPLRWNEHDPLEEVINRLLLLKTALSDPLSETSGSKPPKIVDLDAKQLIERPAMLESLFALLSGAHYQTSPNDLQQLLDSPNLQILCSLDAASQVIGVCLAIEEGGLKPDMENLHGHLIPRLLVKNYADKEFLQLKTWRIMRIAVHPQQQRQAIGTSLIEQLVQKAEQACVDYLSSSFGVTPDLLPFWFHQEFKAIHLGVKRDKASATHALAVARPLSRQADWQLQSITDAFKAQLPHLLMENVFRQSDNELLWSILASLQEASGSNSEQSALQAYLAGHRPYEAISGILWRWSLEQAPRLQNRASKEALGVLIDKVLKKHAWQTVAQDHKLAGRRGVEDVLKALLQAVL
ncbi:GNAT family N-acetyltransferase [Thiomicrorhabdus sp.]|uniref:tRNA(Met) cytidine acetyltransferase TmcA n=1 Tax=Thiomicrorhabdus sp. TaxID=2039724 RepID=UPI0029C98419|nr:GNAT family N-acetyltransferase [Thiomicrorhabdus sp.]